MKFTLRLRNSSLAEVTKVIGYDLHAGRVCVLLNYGDGADAFDVLERSELQLIGDDNAGTYGTADQLEAHLRRRAAMLINGD